MSKRYSRAFALTAALGAALLGATAIAQTPAPTPPQTQPPQIQPAQPLQPDADSGTRGPGMGRGEGMGRGDGRGRGEGMGRMGRGGDDRDWRRGEGRPEDR